MIKRLYQYRDLLLVFIWREFIIRYKQTSIGILWAILQPVSLMLLFTFIFGVVLHTTQKDYPFTLFYFAGVLPWTFFSGATIFSVTSLSSNFHLVTKIYFPREIIPLSGVAINFIDYLIGLAVYFLFLLVYGIPFTWNMLWLVPLLGMLVLFTTSVSLLLSALNVYYRDVKLATTFLIQFLFFATPVIYSIDAVSNRWKYLLFLNPLTFIVENMRRVTIEGREIVFWQFAIEAIGVILLYQVIYRVFIRIERAFADVI
ncbi:MAG: ABC transporter permease [Desulfobulbus sp.]|jgi:ABC-type polysaccharide/polyol phosphate export permease|uniref:ABC transporter permease n=1 Tax=Desulfobulbus sp. TaxID=895 RepID=UPI00283FF2B6|nr:ABC transporter permease [Desulfobulbus sp.]MDR2550386.1 ABC transporter permease [Desulfobulbus sp.]